MKVYAIRGAVTVEADRAEEIKEKSVALAREIAAKNAFDSIVSVVISTTEDIRSFYPARAIREAGALDGPLFSCKEPEIAGALPLCIRLLVTVVSHDDRAEAKHVYLGKASALRKDLISQ